MFMHNSFLTLSSCVLGCKNSEMDHKWRKRKNPHLRRKVVKHHASLLTLISYDPVWTLNYRVLHARTIII